MNMGNLLISPGNDSRVLAVSAIKVDDAYEVSDTPMVRLNVIPLAQGGSKSLTLLTFVASSEKEKSEILSSSRIYKIVGEFLVWKNDEEDVFHYTRLFDQDMSSMEQSQELIELPVY